MAERNIQEVIFLKLLGHKSVLIMAIILNQTIIIIRNIQTHFIAVFFFYSWSSHDMCNQMRTMRKSHEHFYA